MSDNHGAPDPPEDSAPSGRAGEYVLGLLRGEARREFEAEMRRDPELAREVAFWEQRLMPLALAVPEAEPPAGLWSRIANGIAPGRVVAERNWFARLWGNVSFWRGFAAVATAAAIALLVLRPGSQNAPARMVAVLANSSGPMFTVALRQNGAARIMPVADVTPPSGMVWQLWAVAKGERPVPIGFLQVKPMRLSAGEIPPGMAKPGVMITVTVEPPGGSPTGQPTSPIVFSGKVVPTAS